MRFLIQAVLIIVITSCDPKNIQETYKFNYITFQFNALKDNNDIQGSILIFDLKANKYYANDFDWAKVGRIPASTFKIPHSLIALELDILENSHSIFKWNGDCRYLKIWEQDLTFKQAFHYSCVPCYQEIARKVGVESMSKFVSKFNYGQMVIQEDNIDDFWLLGNSKISQFEEIDFLKRLYLSELPISKRTENIFKELFIVKQTDDYTMRAKTGLSVINKNYNGWYVGYIEITNNVYFFATNISPKDKYDKSFNNKHKDITIQALKELKILK